MFNYDEVADRYVRQVDTNPFNADYERPAMLGLLPPLAGLDVLDAGCGAGWYAERLLEAGARVTGVDASAVMVAFARRRLGERAAIHVQDLAAPLPFADGSFDLVLSPLVLHYLPDLVPTLAEFRRVLRPAGTLVFSTHHPCHEADRLEAAGRAIDYFATEPVEEEWDDIGRVRFFRRPLSAVFEALAVAGFLVERVVEPRPAEALRARRPELHARLLRRPEFLCVRAVARP
ncbi:MAG TPA: class I SAM-dependent methyltransferase [Gemmatimonadales bacterium]|nr:class I SAM-dependent methyltransferase [Gemmatimonadales bacterium]